MNRGVIIILGAPGSGKTTQGIMLSEKLNMQHISWGKLLRSPKFHQEEPELYKAIIDKETPNSERAVLIAKALHLQLDQFLSRDSEKSIVMDGYPRRLEEAKELMSLLHHHDLSIRALVLLNASLESIKYRIQNRLVCMQCGRKYDPSNYREQPSKCPYDFNPIVREPYDAEEVKKDYEEYINEVLPAYEYLKTYSESFFSVDGDDEDIVVSSNILINLHSYSKENSQIYVRQSFAKLPTKFGEFKIVVYQNRIDYSFHLAIVKGSVEGKQNVLSRVHNRI
jgi:adenylate kinase